MTEKGVRFRAVIPEEALREFFGDAFVGVQDRMSALMSVVMVRSDESALELERRLEDWYLACEKVEQKRREDEYSRKDAEWRRQHMGRTLEGYEFFEKKWRNPHPFTCGVLWGYSYLTIQKRILAENTPAEVITIPPTLREDQERRGRTCEGHIYR